MSATPSPPAPLQPIKQHENGVAVTIKPPRPLEVVRSCIVKSIRVDVGYVQRSGITQLLGQIRLATTQWVEVQFLELLGGQGNGGRDPGEVLHARAIIAGNLFVAICGGVFVVHFAQRYRPRLLERMLYKVSRKLEIETT